jgi:hypothetical protein
VLDDKLTPNGGAVAIGHPLDAIGVCIGSGQGAAKVLENPAAT